mmetsp:Transcript_51450/g.164732  ORF Transcript_51450/g.164732 Transcript_51450/m.164732 type:complete len:203 (-) Transcript_51450:631-1239(-)
MPKHVQEQKDHSLHSESWQSTSTVQEGRSEQALYSAPTPDTGAPQALGCCAMLLRRTVCALLQEAVQLSQSPQSPHLPSMQSAPQDCVLQAAASLFTRASQAAPPFLGGASTIRLRRMRPPPQEAEQTDQSYHSLHWQSVWGHMPSSPMHGNASSRAPWQPSLYLASGFSNDRERCMLPLPQFAEHADQLDQSDISHTALHG